MGSLIRSMDWSQTPIGPIEGWSPALRMMVGFLLANRFPLLLWWGPDYVQLYNDPYRPVLGTKHPRSMGQPCRECWAEIWHILQPLIDTPFTGGPATWMDDIPLEMNRHGFVEETHFTIAYSPVPDETAPRGIGGVLATVHEITEKVVGERRVVALRDLGARAAEAKTAEEACAIAAETLAGHAKDVPFALLYLIDADSKTARLAGSAGVAAGTPIGPPVIALDDRVASASWPLAEAVRCEEMVVVDGLVSRFERVPTGPWSDPPHTAVVVPVRSNKAHQLAGLLVAGVSPRLKLDELYRSFFELMAGQIATSIANARAYEEERRRAEALAEIDRAKTAFFSNVSHEFRTPLTLMLGPIEDALQKPDAAPLARDDVALVHRNGLRLLRLVNTLLDFSRIESGRVQATYEPVDLAAFTAELASVFRSATDKAGLTLTVDCSRLERPVHVDRGMWEKIVLNLVSNAFKFTLGGGITVRLRDAGTHAVLTVEDTGTGIPAAELPRLFDRFYRVEGARGRTHEGTGIGLALVQELVKLHGGTVRVDSVVDKGSTFEVTIPFGSAHLPQDRLHAKSTLASTATVGQAYVEEALRWTPGEADGVSGQGPDLLASDTGPSDDQGPLASILVADDNADMRDYVCRLLAGRYHVRAVGDGVAALTAMREQRPDLLLSDVMMPRLDGFGLIREIRADPVLADMPVVLLSARAGQEASIEGLEAGADDYLIKPFSARELSARLSANLKLATLRKGFKDQIAADLDAMTLIHEVGVRCLSAGDDLESRLADILDAAIRVSRADKGNIQLLDNRSEALVIAAQRGFERPFLDFFARVSCRESSACAAAMDQMQRVIVEDVVQSDLFAHGGGRAVMLAAGARSVQSTPLVSSAGRLLGMISTHFSRPHRSADRELRLLDLLARQTADYLERRQSVAALRASEGQLKAYVTAAFDVVYRMSPDWSVMRRLDGKEFIADTVGPSSDWLQKYIHPDDQERVTEAIDKAIRSKGIFELEHRVLRVDGTLGWTFSRAIPVFDEKGAIVEWLGAATDITLRKEHEERQRLLIDELNHRVKNTLATVQSVAMHTFRNRQDTAQAQDQFETRLLALSHAHDILTRQNWQGAPLVEIVEQAIAAHRADAGQRFEIEGPHVWISTRQALALSMALHELCTNAAKYGALSNGGGRVRIKWAVAGLNGKRALRLEWSESGGPPVGPRTRTGFGSRLIERGLSRDLRGNVKLDFATTGVSCHIEAPLERPGVRHGENDHGRT